MAVIKKNQLNQILFLMVGSGDFATPKTGITVTGKYYGVNHGVSTATTTGTISKVISEVGSGLYRLTAKATETNFDYVVFHMTGTSCAAQNLAFQCVDNDDSDIMSALTVIQSMSSDAASAAIQANSRLLVNQSVTSDIYSMLVTLSAVDSDILSAVRGNSDALSKIQSMASDAASGVSDLRSLLTSASFLSDIASNVWAAKYTANSAASSFGSLLSDIYSRIIITQSVASDTYSMLSDFYSDFQSRVPKRVATDSQLSDLHSDLRSYLVGMSGMLSDTYSLVSDTASDTRSQIQETFIVRRGTAQTGATTSITLDASAPATNDLYKGLVIALVGGTGASQSREISTYDGSTKIATIIPAWTTNPDNTTIFLIKPNISSRSMLSDLTSDLRSYLVGLSSQESDIYSLLSDLTSDFQSRVPKRVATDSQLSDLHSDLRSYLVGLSATLSDNYSMLSDFYSDFQSRVPKLVATNSQLSDLYSDLRSFLVGMSDTLSVVDKRTSNIESMALIGNIRADVRKWNALGVADGVNTGGGIVIPTTGLLLLTNESLGSGNTTTAVNLGAVASSTDGQYIGCTVWITSGTVNGQFRQIISYDGTTKIATVNPPFTSAPSTSNTYCIIANVLPNMDGGFGASNLSDVASAVWANTIGARVDSRILLNQSRISDTYSMLSDFYSDFQSRVPAAVATSSQLSDLHSDLRSYLVGISGMLSDTYSLTSNINSILVAGVPTTLSTSDISDIASRVWSEKYHAHSLASSFGSLFSVLATNAAAGSSRALINQSRISDVYSLVSDMNSDLRSLVTVTGVALDASTMSDLRSAIAAGPAATITQSDISNIASAVWSEKYHVQSLASSFGSLFSVLATNAAAAASRALLNQSRISDTYSMLSDFYSDFQSRVPKLVATSSQLSDLASDLRSVVSEAIIVRRGVAQTGATSNITLDALASATDNLYKGLIVALVGGTGIGQARTIVSYNGTTKIATVSSSWATNPDNTTVFIIENQVATASQLAVIQSIVSDTYSAASDIDSMLTAGTFILGASNLSDIGSRVWADTIGARVDSRILLNQSRISDTYSMLSDFYSDFQSRVPKLVATNSQLSDLHSDLRSFLVVMSGIQSDIYSSLSDFQSDFQSRVPKRVATDSQLSDLHSDLRSYLVGMSGMLSDTYSLVSDAASDTRSQIQEAIVVRRGTAQTGATTSITLDASASAISDLYKGLVIALVGGTGAGQVREISTYSGSTKVATVIPNWITAPDNTTIFVIKTETSAKSMLSDLSSDLRSVVVGLSGMTSDVYSLLSDMQSDFQSRVPKLVATNSQLSDLASDLKSYLAGMSGAISDTYSMLSDFYSDFQSRVPAVVATSDYLSKVHSDLRSQIAGITVTISTSDISDIASRVWSEKYHAHSLASSFGSLFSVLATNAAAGASRALLNQSRISDVYSLVSDMNSDLRSLMTVTGVALDASTMSDLRSAIAAGPAATITQSDISNIASAVWSEKYHVQSLASSFGSLFSVMATNTAAAASRALLNQSRISDVYSLVSDMNSDLRSLVTTTGVALDASTMSDLRSAIAAGPAATITQSDISNIASAVWSEKYHVQSLASSFGSLFSVLATNAAAGASRALLNQSRISDAYSMLSDFYSDFQSRVPAAVATSDYLSKVHSDLRSQIGGITAGISASDISDIASRVWSEKYHAHSLASSFGSLLSVMATNTAAGSSRALINQSRISDVYSLVSDMNSDLRSLVTTTGVALDASTMSDIRSAITAATFTLTVSDISDIASRVWSEKYHAHSLASSFGSLFSVVATNTAAGASRALINQSRISDTYSMLSDFQSDFQSRVPKRVATDSQLSDLHSDLKSYLGGVSAITSDIYSLMSDFQSDFQSRVPKRVATDSQLSDLHSDIRSYLIGVSATISDIYSSLSDFSSDMISQLSSIQSDTQTIKAKTSNLPSAVKKNTALNNFEFVMINSSDHVTPMTGLSVSAQRSIDGSAFGACTNAVAEVASGVYRINLSATDLNGDVVTLRFSATGADDTLVTIVTNT